MLCSLAQITAPSAVSSAVSHFAGPLYLLSANTHTLSFDRDPNITFKVNSICLMPMDNVFFSLSFKI